MKSYHKRLMARRCGVGGLHCDCCNKYRGRDKPLLRRLMRRMLAVEFRRERRDE